MIKEQVKCPRCDKVLLRMYSTAIRTITCKCGCMIDMKYLDKKGDNKSNGR